MLTVLTRSSTHLEHVASEYTPTLGILDKEDKVRPSKADRNERVWRRASIDNRTEHTQLS